jgi:hypothetical protein
MNVETGTAQCQEKENMNGILLQCRLYTCYIVHKNRRNRLPQFTVFLPSGPWDSDFKNPDNILQGRYV